MSDRNLMTADRALMQTLRSQADRLGRLERRIRFPSSARLVQQSGSASISDQNVGGGSWPTYTTIITMTLDPGRWTVLATANFLRTSSATHSRMRLRFATALPSTTDFELQEVGVAGGAGSLTDALFLPGTDLRTAEFTVTLGVAAGSNPGGGTNVTVSNGALLAIPL